MENYLTQLKCVKEAMETKATLFRGQAICITVEMRDYRQ